MELRKLKSLLGALQAAGVTSYQDADVKLTLGAQVVQVSGDDVEGVDQDWTSSAPRGLEAAVARINETYAPKQKGRAS